MREILFRGKNKYGKWYYGYYTEGYYIDGTPVSWIEVVDRKKKETDSPTVIPETVGQFTGLTDKNGKKIFEGDVVLYPWSDQDKPQRFTIKFKDGQFVASPVKETEKYWDFMVGGYSKEMEIIGNIHDNPELLGGGNDGT